MIIAYWHIAIPQGIDLDEKDNIPFLSANWLEWRPATQEEIDMYNKGIHHYLIKGEQNA